MRAISGRRPNQDYARILHARRCKGVLGDQLLASFDHKGDTKGIPLPATFVKDFSELLSERDVSLSLVSPHPWPHRTDRQMDDFEWSAWRAFQDAPDSVFTRQEVRAGKRVLRVAIADRMTGPACVNCHYSRRRAAERISPACQS